MAVVGAMQTPDGRWRVEAHHERGQYWYAILLDGQPYEYRGQPCDRLVIASVQSTLPGGRGRHGRP